MNATAPQLETLQKPLEPTLIPSEDQEQESATSTISQTADYQSTLGNAAVTRVARQGPIPRVLTTSNALASRLLNRVAATASKPASAIRAQSALMTVNGRSESGSQAEYQQGATASGEVRATTSKPEAQSETQVSAAGAEPATLAPTMPPETKPESTDASTPASAEATFAHFARSSATQIAAQSGNIGDAISTRFKADRFDYLRTAPTLTASIPADELAEQVAANAGPPEPTAMPSAETVVLEPAAAAPELSRDETAVPSKPGGESISTNAGRPPQFRGDGDAHPNRMSPVADKARSAAAAGREAVIGDLAANRSADRIVPVPVDRAERIELPEATSVAKSETTAEMLEYLHTDVPSDVRAVADADFAPLIESSLAGPRQQVQEAANKRDSDRQQAFDEAQAEANAASANAQVEQQKAIADGRARIDEEKQKGLAESESRLAEFDTEVQSRHEAARTEIDGKIADEQARADAKITDGEARARTERENAEKEAKRREDEVRKEKPKKKKNAWGRLTSWFKKQLRKWKKKLKSVVKKVIDAARTVVNGILEAAKNAAVGIIRALRTAVVGMIKTFAAGLKVLVGGLLVFFPQLRERVNAAIDTAVEAAVEIVDRVAKTLEDKVVALIDKVQSAVNRVFDLFETVVMTAIDLAEALLTGNFMEATLILFRAACKTVGIPADEFLSILKDARDAFLDIIKRPAAFLGNLLKSVSQGFSNFMANFRQHFIGGITGWLFGKLAEGGITLPKTFTLKSIFGLLLQVLGFTYEYIRGKVVSLVGEDKVAVVEQVMGHIKTLLTEGPGAIWDWVKDQIGVIKQKIVDAVSEWLITQLIMKAVTKLATMFTPVGAFVQAVLMMYNTIMFFIERMKQIFELVKSITSSFTRIAKGLVSAAADWIERSMANGIPLIIAFLARLIGLGGIGAKVKSVVTKLRQPLDKAIEFVVGKLVSVASKVWGGIKAGAKKVVAWWNAREEFKTKDGENHSVFVEKMSGSFDVMVASRKEKYASLLARIEGDYRQSPDTNRRKAYERAKVAHDLIQIRIKRLQKKGDAENEREPLDLQPLAEHASVLMSETSPNGDPLEFFASSVGLSAADLRACLKETGIDERDVISLAADMTPYVGSGKSLVELLTGKDPITGEEASRWWAAVGLIPFVKVLSKADQAVVVYRKIGAWIARKKKPPKATGKPKTTPWSSAHRKWLRRRTPSDAIRAQFGSQRFDPLYKGVLAEGLEADHIVPFNQIVNFKGFKQLTPENQLRVLNDPDNFVGLAGVINASKGKKTFEEWDRAGGHFLHGRPENREKLAELINKERSLPSTLQDRIWQLLETQ